MKNNLIRKMFIILIITVLFVAAGVFGIVYALSLNAMMTDIRQRADGVRDYILATLTFDDVADISSSSSEGELARMRVNTMLSQLRGVGNLKHLYIIQEQDGDIYTSMSAMPDGGSFMPDGALANDLRRSLTQVQQITGRRIYDTAHGSVYAVFWPVTKSDDEIVGVVCMEFDVDSIQQSYRRMVTYSLSLSAALIALFSIVAFLSMTKSTEGIYKQLAHMDMLTGYENRLSYERRLSECVELLRSGKSVSLLVFDVNNLKTINDSFGHKHGDAYLKSTADILSGHLDGASPLYRIGGDEFAAILTGYKEGDVQRILESVRAEKRTTVKRHPFSCASGAATFDSNTDKSLRDVFSRADEAMYANKAELKAQQSAETAPPSENGAFNKYLIKEI